MVPHERPGETGGGGIKQNSAEPRQKAVAILIIPEYGLPLDSPANNMMQRTWSIYACFAWHAASIAPRFVKINL